MPVQVWTLGDRVITIYADRKVRSFYDEDVWPTLWRSDVPNLTDDQWYISPGPDWRLL